MSIFEKFLLNDISLTKHYVIKAERVQSDIILGRNYPTAGYVFNEMDCLTHLFSGITQSAEVNQTLQISKTGEDKGR